MSWHPDPTFEEDSLFTSGSYGSDYVNAGDGLVTAPKEGWAIMTVVREAVLTSITFGGDVAGGSKIVGQTLLIGTTLWAHIFSLELASGVVELKRGRKNPDAVPVSTEPVEATSQTETWLDGSQVVVSWTAPVAGEGTYRVLRDGVEIASVAHTIFSYTDTTIASGQTYTYQVLFYPS